MNKTQFSKYYLAFIVALLVVSLDFSPVLAASPQNGSYMARFYAPYYYDYIELDDYLGLEVVNSAYENVTFQCHFYIEDYMQSHGVEQFFDVAQLYYKYGVNEPDAFYQYGVSIGFTDETYGRNAINVYVNNLDTPYLQNLEYMFEGSLDTWYNVTMIHEDTNLYIYVNDVLNDTLTNQPDSNLNVNHLRIGEYYDYWRENLFAYNIYVDYIFLDGGGLYSALEWDFESDFSDFDTQLFSDDAVFEIVDETDESPIIPEPSDTLIVDPESQSGYLYEILTYELQCYNDGTEAQYVLEVAWHDEDGEEWLWSFEDDVFTLEAGETKLVDLYCAIGEGNYSRIIVNLRRMETNSFQSVGVIAESLGEDPSTVTPIGEIPSITGYEYALFGLYGSLGLGGLFWGAMGRGREPMVGLIGFIFGIIFFTWIEWLPQWVMVTMFATLAVSGAIMIIGKMGGK